MVFRTNRISLISLCGAYNMTRDLALRLPSTGVMVMIGFVIGIVTGLLFGDMAAVLDPVVTAYIRLLQVQF